MTTDDVGTSTPPRHSAPTTERRAPTERGAPTERRVLADHRGRGGTVVAVPSWEAIDGAALGLPTLALAGTVLRGEGSRLHLPDDVVAWREGSLIWVRTAVPSAPIVMEQHTTPRALDRLPPAADPVGARMVWAFADERAGEVVARAFVAPDREDDAAAVPGAALLAGRLRRPLMVRFATGSVVATRPAPRRRVELGVRVTTSQDEPARTPLVERAASRPSRVPWRR